MTELRPHHFLCIGFYRGRGYSEEFTRNMTETVAGLTDEAPVRIAGGRDVLCKCCPHDAGGVCDTEEKIRRYDSAVMELCGFSAGEVLAWGEIKRRIRERVILSGKREQVCGDCEWSGFCKEVAESEREKGEQI